MFSFLNVNAYSEFSQEKVNQYLNYNHVQIIANTYQNLESCSNDKDKYNVEFPAYTRSDCFKYNQKYSYFICERTYSCNLENITQLANNWTNDVSNSNSNLNTTNNNLDNLNKTNNNTNWKYNLSDAEKKKLDAVLNKIKTQWESYNDLSKYNKLLDTFDAKLDTLWKKYSNNSKVTSMIDYLKDWVDALKNNINNKTSSSNSNADDFFCDLLGNCNSDQKENTTNKENISNNTNWNSSSSSSNSSNLDNTNSQKQELAKYFQDLGVTQNIEKNLDLLSNSNKSPNKALLDKYINAFNNVDNFWKIDAALKVLNSNSSNNETINFSKNYLKSNLEEIKNKVKNWTDIIQWLYRLSNFKYSWDFLKTHWDVCTLEFWDEWEINKNSFDSILMTSKSTPVWNTLDNKYSCNNFTNINLSSWWASYFNSKNTNWVSCSNKLNVSCQKKSSSTSSNLEDIKKSNNNIITKELGENHISKKLKKLTWAELSSIMINVKKDLNKQISSQSNFWYINNYFAVSTKKFSWRDLINKSNEICPTWYKLANLENWVWKYNLEVLWYYLTQNYDIFWLQYDEKTWYKKVSLWSYQNPILYWKLNSVIKNQDKYSNLWLNWFYFEYFSKYWNEKTKRAINKEFYQFYNNTEFISLNNSLQTLCQKNNSSDSDKIPWNLQTINTSQYDLTWVSAHKSKGLLAAFNVIEYEYYMSYSKWVTYTYYEPILDEKWNYVFYYETNKK